MGIKKLVKSIIFLFIVATVFPGISAHAQVSISSDGSDPDPSAMLDVKSSDKGFLPPRMSTAQIYAISSPAEGLLVYNTDLKKIQVFDGTNWISQGVFVCGEQITDIDGNIYNTVLIGTQCWMAENLRATQYQNGTAIPNVTDQTAWSVLTSGAYAWFQNNISWKDSYGAVYNWYATVDPNGLCPDGWHVPTDSDWTAMTTAIGGTSSPHGNELKSCRQVSSPLGGDCNTSTHPRWNYNATHYGTDDYGFSAFPTGPRTYLGTFGAIGTIGYWWSSTEFSSSNGYYRAMPYNEGHVSVSDYNKKQGFSIRCVRD